MIRYMEVAVIRSQSLSSRFTTLSLFCLAFALAGVSGCADMMTYSRDAQQEGESLYNRGDYANAAGAFRNSARQNPRNYQAYYNLGNCYYNLGQYQQAIASYKTARQTATVTLEGKADTVTREKILNGLAAAIAKSDQRDAEIDSLQKEAEATQSAETWYALAKAYEFRSDADSAMDAYNRAALLDPKNHMIAKSYGLYAERIGQRQRADAPLRRAYELNPKDQEVAAALRRIGVVPGPGLLTENQLARPLVPRGPIPSANIPGMTTPPAARPVNDATVQAPRD
jgi:tetratricopeptide (TPR) repeat protein